MARDGGFMTREYEDGICFYNERDKGGAGYSQQGGLVNTDDSFRVSC